MKRNPPEMHARIWSRVLLLASLLGLLSRETSESLETSGQIVKTLVKAGEKGLYKRFKARLGQY